MSQESATTSIDIRPWVADLASSEEFFGNNTVARLDKADKIAVFDVFLSEFEFTDESRVCLSQDGVTIARYDLTRGKGIFYKFPNVMLCPLFSVFLPNGMEEVQALLISESMKRSSQTAH